MYVIKSLFIFLTFSCFATEKNSLETFYSNTFLGEKQSVNYSGPLDPRTEFEAISARNVFLDDIQKRNYLNKNLQIEAFELNNFWQKKILDKSTCPDEELGENYDYIRYLFRLMTISYLFESMKINHQILSELDVGKHSCNLSFNELFGHCTPITSDMKKFKERVYGKFVNEFEKIKYSSFSNKEIESWIELFRLSTESNVDPTFSRIQTLCRLNNKDCKKFVKKDIETIVNNFCEKDKKIINQVCNEQDQLYGISNSNVANEIIRISNAFNVIDQRGMGEDCLRRFVKINSGREWQNVELERQIETVFKFLKKENASYLQGSLFLPGALKEFDIKGLSDFLIALKPPKIEKIKVVQNKVIPKPKIIKKVETKVAEKKIEKAIVPEIIEPEAPKISEFERAVEELKTKDVNHVTIDMDKFSSDFEFTSKMISKLSIPMKKFQTRQALKDMKDYDRFGAKEAPVGIVFLKFLIDTENHQGIYNVINILGDRFYISNDFENKTKTVYAEIRNDAHTKNRWQITLLKYEPVKK
jgi:hypothetical protein